MTSKSSVIHRVAMTAVAAVCMAPSVHINVLYQLGHGGDAALSNSAVSALAVIVAGICPIAIRSALATREWAMAALCAGVFACCLQFNLVSAVGISATLRAESTGAVAKDTKAADSLQRTLEGLIADAAPLKVRAGGSTSAMIEKEQAAMRKDGRWDSTEGCTDGKVTRTESRAFCTAYESKAVALEAANKVEALDKQIAELRPRVQAAQASPKARQGQEADPQTATLVSVLNSIGAPVSMDKVTPVLNLELALILEVISAFGPLVLSYAMGLGKGTKPVPVPLVPGDREKWDKPSRLSHFVPGDVGQAGQNLVPLGQNLVPDVSQPIENNVPGQVGQVGQVGQNLVPVGQAVPLVPNSVPGERPKLAAVPKDDFADQVYLYMKEGHNIRQIAELMGSNKTKVGRVAKSFSEFKQASTEGGKSG